MELFLKENELSAISILPSDPILYKLALALVCAMLTYIMFKPTLRAVQSHVHLIDPLMQNTTRYSYRALQFIYALSYLNIILPFCLALLWFQPFLATVSLYVSNTNKDLL